MSCKTSYKLFGTMKQFAIIGVFFLMLAVALAAMPQMPQMPEIPEMPPMPGKHLGQFMSSGFLKQNAGQQGQQGQGQQHGPPPPNGQNGSGQGENNQN